MKRTAFAAHSARLRPLLSIMLVGLALAGCAGDPREALPLSMALPSVEDPAAVPVDCSTAEGAARLVCDDDDLAALDRQLDEVLEAAEDQASQDQRSRLRAVQQSWLGKRDDCMTQGDVRACIAEVYRRRIAELQARYGLVAQRGPLHFVCGDRPANQISVTWFDTEPRTLIAERGDSESLMYRQIGAGPDYLGRNESLSEYQETITVVWGHGAPQMTCRAVR